MEKYQKDAESYLKSLKDMFYPLKYLEAEGEKLLDNSNDSRNDNSFTRTKLNEMLKAWAADYDEQVDDQPFTGTPLISLVADAYTPMPTTIRSHLPKDSEKLQHQVRDLKLVWDKDLHRINFNWYKYFLGV